jgi:hypothetical protein
MREHPPALAAQRPAFLAVAELQHGMGRQTRAQRRGDVGVGPVDDLDQRLPERLFGQFRALHVGAGDDQRVQPAGLDLLEALVKALDVRTALGSARQLFQRERVHVELGDLVALADQPEELPLGGRQRGVRHHVEQADVQLADILMHGLVARQDGLALLFQAGEGGQIGIGDQGHGWLLSQCLNLISHEIHETHERDYKGFLA